MSYFQNIYNHALRPGTDQLIETYIMTLTKYDFIPIPHSQLAEHAANKVEGNRDQVAKKKTEAI